MQDKYRSLDPKYQKYQSLHDKNELFSKRYEESIGNNVSVQLGQIFGLTAFSYMYVRAQRSGPFKMLPIQSSKCGQYAMMFGATYIAYMFGAGIVRGTASDYKYNRYLAYNTLKIKYKDAPFEQVPATMQ